jgi:hypothetical protein
MEKPRMIQRSGSTIPSSTIKLPKPLSVHDANDVLTAKSAGREAIAVGPTRMVEGKFKLLQGRQPRSRSHCHRGCRMSCAFSRTGYAGRGTPDPHRFHSRVPIGLKYFRTGRSGEAQRAQSIRSLPAPTRSLAITGHPQQDASLTTTANGSYSEGSTIRSAAVYTGGSCD